MEFSQLKMNLNEVTLSMYNQGITDYQFAQIQALQDDENPKFVIEVITSYCNAAETIILDLNKILTQQDLDFRSVDQHIIRLEGSSASIGAKGVQLACADIHKPSDDRNKQGCLQAFNKLVYEYRKLKGNFQTVLQLEEAIFHLKTKQQLQDAKNSAESSTSGGSCVFYESGNKC